MKSKETSKIWAYKNKNKKVILIKTMKIMKLIPSLVKVYQRIQTTLSVKKKTLN